LGEGYIYRKPRKVVGLVTGIKESKTHMEGGWLLPGDAILSVKPGVQVAGGDRLTATWPQPVPDGQVIYRGAAHLNDNSSKQLNLEENEDRLWYNAASSICCVDVDGNEYSSDGDFTLDSSKIIKWHGDQPAQGKTYTLKYNAYLEWIAFIPPEIRVDRGRDIGTRVGLRKKHVHNANANPTALATDRVLFCDRMKGCS
jgi:hypothetical protein